MTNLKDYGNGILASDDFLARIAAEAIERERRLQECREADARQGLCQWGTWAIGDRH